jgi:hypothetical protein
MFLNIYLKIIHKWVILVEHAALGKKMELKSAPAPG